MDTKPIIEALRIKLDEQQILENVPMKLHTSFKAGGLARLMALPGTIHEIEHIILSCRSLAVPYYVMGNGSNLLVRDSGFEGLIIKLGDQLNQIAVEGSLITAEAGALLSSVAKAAADHGLTGMEGAAGIPGSIGGGIVMNAGAYGWEMKDSIVSAACIAPSGALVQMSKEDLNLTYRHSALQESGTIVISAVLQLRKGDISEIKATMNYMTKKRNERQPVTFPSAGSVFKRPEGYFAGQLIEEAGLKGLVLGGAQVSPMHAGFIINADNATADDIINLIELVKLTVFDNSGVKLEEEVRILG